MPEANELVRVSDPHTSWEAAESVIPKLKKLQVETYEVFKARHFMTDLDLQYCFNNHRSTYRTRRRELTDMGLLRDSGRRLFQEGANRIVWELVTPPSSNDQETAFSQR